MRTASHALRRPVRNGNGSAAATPLRRPRLTPASVYGISRPANIPYTERPWGPGVGSSSVAHGVAPGKADRCRWPCGVAFQAAARRPRCPWAPRSIWSRRREAAVPHARVQTRLVARSERWAKRRAPNRALGGLPGYCIPDCRAPTPTRGSQCPGSTTRPVTPRFATVRASSRRDRRQRLGPGPGGSPAGSSTTFGSAGVGVGQRPRLAARSRFVGFDLAGLSTASPRPGRRPRSRPTSPR